VIRGATSAGFRRVVGMHHGISGLLDGDLVDLAEQPPGVLDLVRRTPSAALGATRHRPTDDELGEVLDRLRALDVRSLLYIGGNDSADTLHRIYLAACAAGYVLHCIHVPKTIDNDLVLTDHTPGYGSAARHVAILTRDAGRDSEAMRDTDPVKLVEVPGRNSGWLAAAASLARESDGDAPHIIIPPEARVEMDALLRQVESTLARRGFVVAVVAETARGFDGRPLGDDDVAMGEIDPFGHRRLTGAASYLCGVIADRLKLRARWEKPGTLIRTSGTCLSEVDLAEAEMVGRAAVSAAVSGTTDVMISLVRDRSSEYRCTTRHAPLAEIANRERPMPPEFMSAQDYDTTPAFESYARPLIGGPLPAYGRLLDSKPL
jgi:ATP-dependent phosphofructokinase / diphosphate-dependent phosphofructokinase